MNTLFFDFRLDKATKTVVVTKEFDAERSLVWAAFTQVELLDQWWAPGPYASRTKDMEFKVGGRRFYAMVSPEGVERWSLQHYTSISPETHFKYTSVFADADGTPHWPGSEWDLTFTEANGRTTVTVSIHNESLERMEQMIAMGFKEGFTMILHELDNKLPTFKQ